MADRRLQVFHAVAKQLSFTKAAEILFMTQPAVTFQVKQLEEHFNTRLFDRGHGRITLTPAGDIVLAYAERILGLSSELDVRLAEMTGEIGGSLLVGASTTIADFMLPSILGEFKSAHPDVRPRLVVGGQTTAVTATVTDRFANPVPQVLVNFSSNIGGLGVIDGLTSASGLVTTTLATGYRVGIARLRADSGNLVASLDLPVLAGPPASLSLSTDGSVLKLGQSAQVSAMVRDSYANPVSGALVDFAFDLGAMSPPSGATGTDGLARSRLSAQRGGVGLLEARVGALYRGIRIDVQGRRVFMPRLERRR